MLSEKALQLVLKINFMMRKRSTKNESYNSKYCYELRSHEFNF